MGATSRFDRGRAALEAIVRQIMRRTVYHYPHAATVLSQNGDGSVDVTIDDGTIPGTTNVTLLFGLPDAKVKVNGGARCVVGFIDANPRKPMVLAWLSATATEIDLIASGTTMAVVREGDTINVGSTSGAVVITSPKSKLKAG